MFYPEGNSANWGHVDLVGIVVGQDVTTAGCGLFNAGYFGARSLLIGSRDDALCHRRRDGVAIDALSVEFGISRRSVFRVLAKEGPC